MQYEVQSANQRKRQSHIKIKISMSKFLAVCLKSIRWIMSQQTIKISVVHEFSAPEYYALSLFVDPAWKVPCPVGLPLMGNNANQIGLSVCN